MEYSMDAVADKVVQVILCLSVLIAVAGFVFYFWRGGAINDGAPFAIGVAAAASLNTAKVLLLKRAVNNALTREPGMAQFYLQGQYFLRLMLTLAVLIVAGWLHNTYDAQYINVFGTVFGIFTLPIANYSMRYFFREHLRDNPAGYTTAPGVAKITSPTQDAINKLKSFGAEQTEADITRENVVSEENVVNEYEANGSDASADCGADYGAGI